MCNLCRNANVLITQLSWCYCPMCGRNMVACGAIEPAQLPTTSANTSDASPQGEMPPTEIERDYTFHTSEKNLVAFTETWDEHPDWWGDLPCLCSSCKDYGDRRHFR